MWQTITGLVVISQVQLIRLVLSMLLGIVLGLAIGFLYKHTNRGMNYEASFLATLVLLVPIVNIIMLFIQGDLVLSLGLVGSLSIIRFRTPIKDTRDMVFIFWAIATGLGTGTFNIAIVVIGNLIISLVILIMYYVDYGLPTNRQYVLVITGTVSYSELGLEDLITTYTSRAFVRSHNVKDGVWERVFELNFPKSNLEAADNLLDELTKRQGIIEVSLLAPQLALPM